MITVFAATHATLATLSNMKTIKGHQKAVFKNANNTYLNNTYFPIQQVHAVVRISYFHEWHQIMSDNYISLHSSWMSTGFATAERRAEV